MAISRMDMERQLRAGGGIMTLEEPRQGYFLGKIVKKAKRAVKKVTKSPLGKLALLGLGAYGLGGAKFLGGKGIFAGGQGLARFSNLLKPFQATGKLSTLGDIFRVGGKAGEAFSVPRMLAGGLGAAAVAAPFLMGGDEEEEVPEESFTGPISSVESIRDQARAYYGDPTNSALYFMPQKSAVQSSFYADGGLASIDTPKRGMVDGPGSYAGFRLMDEGNINNRRPRSKFDFLKETGPISESDKKLLENLSEEELKELQEQGGPFIFEIIEKILKTPYLIRGGDVLNDPKTYPGNKNGGRIGKAEGGLMDLGGFEKDYREGGFVPLGAEERADDVPARLSKNEFVFTADAVRNAGQGDIDKGAEVMQNMMDNLEAGGTISEESQGMENPAQAMFDQAQQLESRIE